MAAAANPAQRPVTGLAPYYRRYELPWSPSEEMERRFRKILRNLVIVFAIVAVLIPFLPRQERVVNTESLPERVVQLVAEPPPPPPPPPKPEPQKPTEKAPVTPKPVAPVDARVKASKSGLLASVDDLAALRDIDLDKLAKNQPKTTDPGDVTQVTRSLITSKAGGTSGGISAPSSSGLASGGGSLNGIHTTQVTDPKLASGQGNGSTRGGGSGKVSRSADEIALVFTRNKGAIDAMYARALRDNPALQGKVVLEITISPAGDITAARVISSDLNDPEFESKLLARIKLFKFEAKDVATLTATKPIDFFPAG
jgi:protein TonB